MVVGDWGRDGMCCQRDVAVEMGVAAVNFTPGFVANVGDSFYPSGLGGVRDEQVDTSWKGVYGSVEGLAGVVWRSVLGNHDYRGDVDAQIELTEKEPLWHMPARWYFEEESDGGVLLAFLDTTPLYYDEDEMDEMDGGLGGEAAAAAAQRKKVRDAQISAVAGRLKKSSARVKLVFGHHPLFSSAENALTESAHLQRMIRHLAGILSESGVTAYFSGHEHTMEHTVFGGVHYFVVGSGSKVNPVQMLQAGSVFALGRQGFAMVAVEDTVVHVQFVDMTGHVVHATSIGPGAKGAAMEAASREQALVSVMAGGAEAAGPSLLEEVAVSA
jgi:tartrate-resistant acid phosphatase type 5